MEANVGEVILQGKIVSTNASMILIILTVRLFRFFKLQPQLAVISKTVLQLAIAANADNYLEPLRCPWATIA